MKIVIIEPHQNNQHSKQFVASYLLQQGVTDAVSFDKFWSCIPVLYKRIEHCLGYKLFFNILRGQWNFRKYQLVSISSIPWYVN